MKALRPNIIADASLAKEGRRKIEWVKRNMPILTAIQAEFERDRPFEGLTVTVSVHLEAKTAYLAEVIAAGGATVTVTGSNSLSTKDDVVAALAAAGLNVYAKHGASPEEFTQHQIAALEAGPDIVIDDGGDLVHHLHEQWPDRVSQVFGGCEETTAGVQRNRTREVSGTLQMPVIAVNDALMKHLFDNRYGTGQSTFTAIMGATNLLITGKTVVVAGYGWVGRGVAMRAVGLGARVIVTEVDEVKALEAVMDGHRVMPINTAAAEADYIISTTGVRDVVGNAQLSHLRDGVILANAGHFADEIAVGLFRDVATEVQEVRENLTGYRLFDGRWIYVVADGKIVNISAADGHPAEIMDTSFAVQALAARYVAENRGKLPVKVLPVPAEIDRRVARMKLEDLGVRIDTLTPEQEAYLKDVNR